MKQINKQKKINIITMGCSKNLVDSETLMRQIENSNFQVVHNQEPNKAEIVIVNTCGFINDAKQESIDTILQLIKDKKKGKIEQVFVMGCLSQRYKKELAKEIPEVDKYFGVNDLKEIVETLQINFRCDLLNERHITTPSHYAYLKISEGCNRKCSFCAIPLIRGQYVSKPIEILVDETKFLVEKGVKELIIIAQDLSYYGYDLYKKYALADLLAELVKIHDLKWIRLHYAYPLNFDDKLIDFIKQQSKICKYLDIPFQHISDKMLKTMRRGNSKTDTLKLVDKLKKAGFALRTTLMLGFPNESEADFAELLDFVKTAKFDRLGTFTYSEEEGTYAQENFADNVETEIKNTRAETIMQVQQEISLELNSLKIGQILETIIDSIEGDYYIGRTEFDSPEVDNEVLIETSKAELEVGEFYKIKITSATEFELFGEVIDI